MKKILFLVIIFLNLILINSGLAENQVVNIYVWSGYLPDDVIRDFTKETGIRINLSEYDTNETMYAKLKSSPKAGYDIVIPSSYFVDRMSKQGMLHQLDKSKLPNFKNLNPLFLHKPFDPNNDYSVPYLWGATGIVVNKNYFKEGEIQSWKDLWNPKYKDQVMMLSDVREVFGMALLALGYPSNDTDPEHLRLAYLKLKDLLPNIKIFNTDAEQTIYIDEDAILGMGFNGDIHLSQLENPDVQFIYPKEGFVLWVDCLAVTKNAPNLENAYKLINFLMRPDIAKRISLSVGYPLPNAAAMKLLPKEIRDNQTIYPNAQTLSRAQFQVDVGNALPIYEKYWELLKIGG